MSHGEKNMPVLTLDVARQLLDRTIARASQDFDRPVCVAVCDRFGFLIAFSRMEGAPVRSILISQQKAYSATRMGMSTDAFLARIKREGLEIGYFCDPLLTALPGGSVLKDGAGAVVGGIGVSGLTSAEDHSITESMAESLRAGMPV
jgi:uncharacterized protein GlcG (DUF336 family)